MTFFRDLILGGIALKGLKQSNPPTIIPPQGYLVTGMSHKGFGSSWKITYCKESSPNKKLSFTISKGMTGRTEGSASWSFNWN